MIEEKAITDTLRTAVRITETTLKKAWSLMEAAAQKERPSEYLSEKAINAIQGVVQPEKK